MRDYNETKRIVLGYLDKVGPSTAREIAAVLEITPLGASSYLLKLHRRGLLGRRRIREPVGPSRERIYYVRERGVQRLSWLDEQADTFVPRWVGDDDSGIFKPRWVE